ncbi:unnamed protein product [Heligmosomoides polygyrus]|uniref:Tim44 domain-containing protein n=1 Tax=Heligmosomoides polygyrus TaxID=6339 RepID=A0A183FNZ7_HELPZ|nr:unnamed protein product [Heligmosomoides polygyrus]
MRPLLHRLRNSAKGAERRLFPETLELIRQRGAARASGNYQQTSDLAKQCRAAIKEDLTERRARMLSEVAEKDMSIQNAFWSFAYIRIKMPLSYAWTEPLFCAHFDTIIKRAFWMTDLPFGYKVWQGFGTLCGYRL